MVSREKKKQEAVFRMKKLGLSDDIIKRFEEDGVVSQSSGKPVSGKMLRFIKELEDKHGVLIYYVLTAATGIGEIDSYLLISENEEAWTFERSELENNRASAYFRVDKIPEYSEFCAVGFEITAAGIRCTGRAV